MGNDNNGSRLKFPEHLLCKDEKHPKGKDPFQYSKKVPGKLKLNKHILPALGEIQQQFNTLKFPADGEAGDYYNAVWDAIPNKTSLSPKSPTPTAFLTQLNDIFLLGDGDVRDKLSYKEFIRNTRFRVGRIIDLVEQLKKRKELKEEEKKLNDEYIDKVNNSFATTVVVNKKGEFVLNQQDKIEFVKNFLESYPLFNGKKAEDIKDIGEDEKYIKVYLHPLYNEISHPMLIAYEVFRYLTSPEIMVSFKKDELPYADAFFCAYSVCKF